MLLPSWPILSISFSSNIDQNQPPLALNACHSYVMLAILASQLHGGNTSQCDCEARIASLGVPAVKITPNRLNTINYTTRWCNFHHGDTSCPPQGTTLSPASTRLPPLPKTPPDAPCPYYCVGGVHIALPPPRAPTEKLTIFCIVMLRCHPTVTAPSHHGSSARFDKNIRNIIIDVSLLRRRVAHLTMITGDDNRDSNGTDRATIATSRGQIATTTINHWKGRRERRWQSKR
jgi:hypothetical protein